MPRSRARPAAVPLAAALLLAACGGTKAASRHAGGAPVEVKVFAAASLTESFGKLAGPFSAAHPGVKVTYEFAGSQALAAQIQQGAPADVFASADTSNMDKVKGLVAAPQAFAGNLLEIAVGPGNPEHVTGLADLARRDLKVVLAAPAVPAGKYARQALDARHIGVSPVSLEQDVKAAVNKVALGEADATIVYVTDVRAARGKVDGVEIPAAQNVPATYPIAVVKASRHQAQAQAFVDFVRAAQGQQLLQSFGFGPPPSS